MKLYAALGLAALLTGFGVAGAHAQSGSIYVYNFNDAGASGTNSAANTAALFAVDKNNTSHPATGSALTSNFTAASITNFAGTTVNADGTDTAGQALALQAGTSLVNNGAYLQATANLTGYQGIKFSFATQGTATGFTSDQFQYSFDGTNFVNFGTPYTPATAFALQSFDLSSIGGLNNNANAAFRIVFSGASGTTSTGNNRLDNLIISGTALGGNPITAPVPEASTTISLGLMLALGGLAFAVKKKKASAAL